MSELRVERKENMAGMQKLHWSRDVLLDIMSITTRVRHIISFVGREIMMTMDVSAR